MFIGTLADVVRGLPWAVFDARMLPVQHETVYAFSRWLHANGPVSPQNLAALEALANQLVDFMAAGLMAPALPTTMAKAQQPLP